MDNVAETQESFSLNVGSDLTEKLLTLSSDIVLYICPKGNIKKAIGQSNKLRGLTQSWVGKSWKSVVTVESKLKIDQLLKFEKKSSENSAKHINHSLGNGVYLPVSYSTLNCEKEGFVVAVGKELSQLASLQQKLVSAQQTLEKDFIKLRHIETQYRSLFDLSSSPILICEADENTVVEINPAAAGTLGFKFDKAKGKNIQIFFRDDEKQRIVDLLKTAELGKKETIKAQLIDKKQVSLEISCFRQENKLFHLIQIFDFSLPHPKFLDNSSFKNIEEAIRKSPDAFLVCDVSGKISFANEAFLDLAEVTSIGQDSNLMSWLGRGRVDFSVMQKTIEENGVLKLFSTQITGKGSTVQVEICGVELELEKKRTYAFSIRNISRRLMDNTESTPHLSRSAEQLSELVGQLPLKDIVSETTDLIEKLCIEAALNLSLNNRVSAAEMLGLSRQSLYVKMRKLNIGDDE